MPAKILQKFNAENVLLLRKILTMVKIGDKVKFLNDVGGGIVTGFVNKTTVNVENEDGFEIPCPVSQLVNVSEMERMEKGTEPEPAESVKVEKQNAEFKEEQGRILTGKDSPDFYFCLVPDDSKNPLAGETSINLVNDSNFTLLYHYSHFLEGKYITVKFGSVQPNSKMMLESIDQNDLTKLPDFVFQLIYFSEEDNEQHPSLSKKLKINPVKFYKESSFQSNEFFKKNAMVLKISPHILNAELDKLTDEDLQKVIRAKEKEQESEKKVIIKKKPAETVEVDLHIAELIDNNAGLTNKEILDIQLEKVHSEMREAIKSHVKRIVFIHGLGHGVLKQEVAKLLKSKFPKYYFQDASFKEYGYGATMVILRK